MSQSTLMKKLSSHALKALEEARNRKAKEEALELPREIGGRGGLDPSRFGDWEKNGIAIDF
ncbi:hypothetical protein RL73_06250 [Liberibacter crescens]|nr:hypothetical protein RL73_06250 [Liberibacter crescens]